MEDLTFGEQVKIVLGRRGMTIKRLAELIEERTGKKMSRQNLTQRLGRDNFQEQDMRLIAEILECPFQLSILAGEIQPQERAVTRFARAEEFPVHYADAEAEKAELETAEPEIAEPEAAETESADAETAEPEYVENAEPVYEEPVYAESIYAEPEEEEQEEENEAAETMAADERDMTIGELYEIHEELSELEENARAGEPVESIKEELEKPKKERFSFFRRRHTSEPKTQPAENERNRSGSAPVEDTDMEEAFGPEKQDKKEESGVEVKEQNRNFEPVISHEDAEEDTAVGEINPYTGREYQSNSVRMHPSRIGYVQVYDRTIHKWTDMTEWAFLGYQERKKALLGKAYEPPIYLD